MKTERRIAAVPVPVIVLVIAGLALQIGWHTMRPGPSAAASDLPAPPAVSYLRVASFGEPVTLARLLMLWLQAFDNQPGVSIPFRNLDYDRVEGWLSRILALDPGTEYPLLAAARVYAEVADEPRQRQMLEFIYRQFLESPDTRWRWLAHASLVAKHRLEDMPLALRYAEAITTYATGSAVPYWARDLSVILLQDMAEYESAVTLVARLLDSGMITDPYELRFLEGRLAELKARQAGEKSDDISSDR